MLKLIVYLVLGFYSTYMEVVQYLQEHPKLADDFTVEVYGTVGDKCLEVMKGTGVPFKVFQSKLGYSRL